MLLSRASIGASSVIPIAKPDLLPACSMRERVCSSTAVGVSMKIELVKFIQRDFSCHMLLAFCMDTSPTGGGVIASMISNSASPMD